MIRAFSYRLIKAAAHRIADEDLVARYAEEWKSELEALEHQGFLQLLTAIRIFSRAFDMNAQLGLQPRPRSRGPAKPKHRASGVEGLRQLDTYIGDWIERSATLLTRGGVPATLLTFLALALAPIVAGLFVIGQNVLATLGMYLLLGTRVVDGPMLRLAANPRRALFFGQISDRIGEAILFGAIAFWGFNYDPITGIAALLTLALALLSSYVWALAHTFQLRAPISHVGAAERHLALTFGMMSSAIFPVEAMRIAVFATAVLTTINLIERLITTLRSERHHHYPTWLASSDSS
jgi:phosphatidylglycerophosphate synthase